VENKELQQRLFRTQDLTLSASLAALYIITTFFPFDAFLGGAGIISYEIISVPLIAALLRPRPAVLAAIVGSLGMAAFHTGTFPAFGFFALAVPIVAITMGSIGFHIRYGSILEWGYVLFGAVFYVAYSRGGTLLWLAPYTIVIASLPLALKSKGRYQVVILAFYTAMCWQVTLNILSIGIVGLVDGFWTVVTPFMFLERTVATIGSATLIVALKSRLEDRLELSQEVLRR
jgi:hypothetical protein